jgi:hypothetical protein
MENFSNHNAEEAESKGSHARVTPKKKEGRHWQQIGLPEQTCQSNQSRISSNQRSSTSQSTY